MHQIPTEKSRRFYLKFSGAASRLLRPDVTGHDCKICPDRPKCGGRCGGWTLVSRSSRPSHDRKPAVASLDAQRPQHDRRRRGSDQSRCGPSHMARPAPALLRIPDRKNGLWPTQTAARVTAATGPPPAHWPWMQTRSRGAGDTARDPRRFCDLCGILRRTAAEAAAWIETISERGESGKARPAHAGPAATPARNQCSTKRCSRKAPGLRLGKGAWGRKGSAANSDGRWPPQKGLRPRPRRPPPPRRPSATASTPGMQPLPNAAT